MRKSLIPLTLSLVFLVVSLLTLSDYGINWDAPLSMLRGQAYADIYLNAKVQDTFETSPIVISPSTYGSRYYFASVETDQDAKKARLSDRPIPQRQMQKDISFYHHPSFSGEAFREADAGHLPLVPILSAFSNRIFFGMLGWLGDIESYRLVYLLFSAVGVFIVAVFAYEISGSVIAGVVAGISLTLFPLFFAEVHINPKDPIQASFFAGAIWAFWNWMRLGRLGWFGVFGAFVALALAVKWNIVFLPLILIPWLFSIKFKHWGRLGKLGGLGILGVMIFLIAAWPYAWVNPIQALTEAINYYLQTGVGKALIQPSGFILPGGFNVYPLLLILTQTPEIILVLGGVGVVWAVRGVREDKLKTGYLLLLWMLVPLLRLSFPGARTYGGLRQIMEIIPAMAVLAGVGGYYLVKRVQNNITIITIIIIITVILVFPIVRFHPNQNTYFNSLVGGLAGAKEKGLIDWTLTYGNIYKQGALWLNKNAKMNSNIAHLSGADFALSPLYLRDDISISPYHFSGFRQSGEYILALYNPLDPPVFAKRYPERFLNPVHKIKVDRVPLLFIYKNDPKYLKQELGVEKELKAVKMIPQTTPEADFWKIDLGQDFRVTRIMVNGVDSRCMEGFEQKEAIAFIPQSQVSQPIDLTRAYVLNEKIDLGESRVEYLFAAELARFIYIYPQNHQSCFAKDVILSVSYLDTQ